MVLRLRRADVYGLDVVDSTSARPKWLNVIGGHYVDGRKVPADQVEKTIGAMDLILDASGIAALEFNCWIRWDGMGSMCLQVFPEVIVHCKLRAQNSFANWFWIIKSC